MRFFRDEEVREAMEEEFGQLAPQDIIDILVTSRPTQLAKKIRASLMNSTTDGRVPRRPGH